MPGHILDAAATIQCPHVAPAKLAASGARLLFASQPAALAGDQASVSGCPFQVPIGTGTKPQPCVAAVWTVPATRVRSAGKFVLIHPSPSICRSTEGIPQGAASVIRHQTRVRAT